MELTPKEKAKELMQEVYDLDQYNKTPQSTCKEIALLCINKQLALIDLINNDGADDYYEGFLQVKEELEKM